MEAKVAEWRKLKENTEMEKRAIQEEQHQIENAKTKWRDARNAAKEADEPTEQQRSELLEQKKEIDERIRSVNSMIEANKAATMRAKELEAEVKPYLQAKRNAGEKKESFRKMLDFGQNPEADLPSENFEDLESIALSSEQEAKNND